jgi:lysozyme
MNRAQLKVELVRDEGLRLKPYRCTAGKLTIGVGRNLEDRGISESEAAVLLENDIRQVEADLERRLPFFRSLTDARQRVLVNMGFNLGVPGLLKFENTLKLIEAGKYADAAAAMLDSKWAKQVGARAARLSQMMKEG